MGQSYPDETASHRAINGFVSNHTKKKVGVEFAPDANILTEISRIK